MFAKPRPVAPPPTLARPKRAAFLASPAAGAGASFALFAAVAAGLALSTTTETRQGPPPIRVALAKIEPLGPADEIAPPPVAGAEAAAGAIELSSIADPSAPAAPLDGPVVIDLPTPTDGTAGAAALPQAPIAGLSQAGPGGPLPIIGPDGRTPFKAYARPFVADGRPRIALVIGGLGLNAKATREAIASLPPEVTLSFVPYADGLQGWIDMARAAGHEVLLETPMEPKDYPQTDPGPYTLMADAPAADTVRRLDWLLSRATGYYGLTNYLGGKFAASPTAMATFSSALRSRGLAFIDDGVAAGEAGGLPRATASRIIDQDLAPNAIEAQLAALEGQATRSGAALGAGFAYPVTLETAQKWALALSAHGFQLAPASAVMVQR